MKHWMKAASLGLALMALPVPGMAMTWDVALTQDGVGDSGADWFGTAEAPGVNQLATSASFLVSGVTCSGLAYFIGLSVIDIWGLGLGGVVAETPQPSPLWTVLQFNYTAIGGVLQNRWAFSPCLVNACGGGDPVGTYTITERVDPSPVPLPATLPLFGAALLGLGLRRRRAA